MAFFKKENKPDSHFTTPRLPISPLLDIITGELMRCEKGDFTVNGGFSPHLGIIGKGNANKTLDLISFLTICIVKNMSVNMDGQIFETENTLEFKRILQILRGVCISLGMNEEEISEANTYFHENFILRNTAIIDPDQWYMETNDICAARIKSKSDRITLPFKDLKGDDIKIYTPHLIGIDSFSAMVPTSVQENYLDKNTAGHKDNNMMYMREMGAKTQMMQKWLNQNPKATTYMISTAHLGDNTGALLQTTPPEKKMAFMKQNHKIKNVPEKYYFYTTTLLYINGSAPLLNGKGVPQYPMNSEDVNKKDNRDILLEAYILRNKYGQSGAFIPLVANQNEGINFPLSEFNFCKTNNNFGFSGNDQNYVMDLLPEVKLSRTVVRRKLLIDPQLRRVVAINCELQLMYRYWYDKINDYKCTPNELYTSLVHELGYDWDMLLNTRGNYTLDHYKNPINPLSTFDMLRMRKLEYVPYWMAFDDIPAIVKEKCNITKESWKKGYSLENKLDVKLKEAA